ncbi:MAG: S1 RNA-binding domain-containing protein, partial [Candidatus Omnitrophota bacterium]|nr:S1 RNA-binding domain-containing protein [Candidatus Omnitrophota bacterium]
GVTERYKIGDHVIGTVTDITSYGALIELEEGIEGFVRSSDLSWTEEIIFPGEILKKDEEIEAVILDINEKDRKIALGIKQLLPDPWEGVTERYKVGQHIKVTVTNLDYQGVLAELEEGIKGFIHPSDLSWTEEIIYPGEILKKDEEIEAVILDIDEKNRKIVLGIKQLMPDPWGDIVKRYKPGTITEGKIINVSDFAITVELEENLKGSLSVTGIGIPPSQRIENLFKVGDIIDVTVKGINNIDRRLILSLEESAKKAILETVTNNKETNQD